MRAILFGIMFFYSQNSVLFEKKMRLSKKNCFFALEYRCVGGFYICLLTS